MSSEISGSTIKRTMSTISKDPSSDEVPNNNDVTNYKGFDSNVASKIQDLARTLSRSSTLNRSESRTSFSSLLNTPPIMPFVENNLDPRLDPNSDKFDSKLWVMNFERLTNSDPDYYKPSSLGVIFKGLEASGTAVEADYQTDFSNFIPKYSKIILDDFILKKKAPRFNILKPMDGLLKPGQLCVVLGKPGAGCTTFLKSIATETYGFETPENSEISYDGISPKEIHKHYRGDVVYCAETENHFANLLVGDTLKFAAQMRTPQNRPDGVARDMYAQHMSEVIMATYGLSHTKNTRVGNDFIRGVSGGERKRVSICEVALSGAKVQCWDNSTRGLDSATALEFVKALKTAAVVQNRTPMIAIYQCSQGAYDIFDTVQLLYEGYQIYFGDAKKAKDYFLTMGYECPPRQTTADYLTSVTSPSERIVRKGMEGTVPSTPKEMYDYWMGSPEHAKLLKEIDEYKKEIQDGSRASAFKESYHARQSKKARPSSPYTLTYFQQIKCIMHRNWLRTKGDPSITLWTIFANSVMALIISSVFYNLRSDTSSFYYRTSSIFFAILFNAFGSLLEVFSLFEARPIVEKHKTYGLYHPSADALASIITELPTKIFICLAFNLIFYFMVNLRRTPGHFFFYLLVNFTGTLSMSHIFRSVGAASRTLSLAMTPAAILLLIFTIYTGFVVPIPDLLGWSRWIHYLNPIQYAFEALIANEFHNRKFPCAQFVPTGKGYPKSGENVICTPVSSKPGESYVDGDAYINLSFEYYWDHRWRDWGIVLSFVIFFLGVYLLLCEFNRASMQKGEILLFQKKSLKKSNIQTIKDDLEAGPIEKVRLEDETTEKAVPTDSPSEESHKNIFHWKDLTYQVKIKSEDRVILDHVSGFVKPGTVTALMGASGAGKTTLLNALSDRLTSGVITEGKRMVNGHPLDKSFQRSIGYVQQQDLHLEISTVREALLFSAELRQPASVPREEKIAYVEEVIDLLEMRPYAGAVVGVAGEGLNVEQRKRLTIGVELAAKPELLVFLDEPTSGLDSQTAWSICQLIRKLANHGHAILCTIHQPSAILMQEFDRLLFLQRGGQTVYFGELGAGCHIMIDYFEKYGAPKCPPEANPAEWMLEVIGAAPGSHAEQNYYDVWRNSSEFQDLHGELNTMETELSKLPVNDDPEKYKTYAASFSKQYLLVTQRVFQQTWRTPSYIYSKLLIAVASSLFNGFTFFMAKKSLQGLQSQMFAIFMFIAIFGCLVQQYLPNFVAQRDIYEARERPSRTFSWVAFITAQITSEIPWQIFAGTIAFFCWYYPVGLQHNASYAGDLHGRGAMMWIVVVLFYVYTSTFAQLAISFNEHDANAANLCVMLFTMCLIFCGVLSPPNVMPGFWIFMYRCNPMTYVVSAMLSLAVSDNDVTCASNEYLKFPPPQGMSCYQYMEPYISIAGGYLLPSTINSTTDCSFCAVSETNTYLHKLEIKPSQNGRNVGIFSAYIFIDMIGTVFFYWLARVPKGSGKRSS
ncbi:ATP-binding cassette multidrug transporter [Saccharomycopsis crataegensis]|uniref:ATP-binding cassette multidrug transporter n=1 Tax=Saccharomycopsis crataegensis TaxID=43959 RepID=A0AAV5QV34_9ASCO|nr:ATP-binding cassette multidrug transporter [Saccharomycopsis crataegensis]